MRALAWVALAMLSGCVVDATCPAGKSRCGGYCIDESSDVKNCGACYLACAAGDSCVAGRCLAPPDAGPTPTCSDGVKNASETAIDCGGGCRGCGAGQACSVDADCASEQCRADRTCASGPCDDGVKDDNESDVDCGASCPNRCGPGAHCNTVNDCDAGACLPAGVCGTEGLTLMSDRSILVVGSSQMATLTASLVGDGAPLAGVTVTFTAAGAGALMNTIVGSDGGSVAADTDSSGHAVAQLNPGSMAGQADITALALAQSAATTVSVTAVNQIEWVSTTCGGSNCTQLGSIGSGFNEVAQMKFRVRDSVGLPVADFPVTFSITNPPPGTGLTPTAVTDANGLATTSIHSGASIGSFSVHAVAAPGVTVDSPTISIVGAKPTNDGFVFQCAKYNLAAYDAVVPPAVLSTNCTVALFDCYSNPVLTGTSVNLKTEAGVVPWSVQLSPTMGMGTFIFTTVGAFPPRDVAPLPADATQTFPGARDAEPSTGDAGTIRNPRDGLVTLIAYAQGEEFFVDSNTNGIREATEPFIDQGEPFVDENDDGVQDGAEFYFDGNGNGMWDGPNGVWDSNTTIWADVTLLYTDHSSASLSYFSPADYGACPGGVAKGAFIDLQVFAPDDRLNVIEGSSTFSVSHTADAGSLATITGSVLDGYGFYNFRAKVNASGNACNFTIDPICYWKRLFQSWGGGEVGIVRVYGAPATDTNPCVDDVLTVTATTGGVPVQFSTSGAIQ